ncbi:cholesterol 24-hydroxylase-like [Hyla sarda]|uniref:cholesterol 24-hydroxylase-like n=1 Tax=Hyla sarda TaxID=327740 RepID=UPI0024C32CCD|nr:cholesterol 24-hydroxylase-like [Hyla sarda]
MEVSLRCPRWLGPTSGTHTYVENAVTEHHFHITLEQRPSPSSPQCPDMNGYIYYIHMKYDHIPGLPRDSFFFGHLPSMLRVIENNGLVHDLFLEWFMGNGLVTDQDNDHWSMQRKVIDPSFKKDCLIEFMETFNEKAEELEEQLSCHIDRECQVAMHEMLRRVTLNVIAKVYG